MARKVIITCAVTGSIHTPSMSPHLPVRRDEIAEAALAAREAGASIVHLHARKEADGRPSQDPEDYLPVLKRIHAESDVVMNITSGGSPHMSVEERMQPILTFKPELASLNMGSMNMGLFPMLKKYDTFQYPWEKEHLEASWDLVFKNTYADIYDIVTRAGANGTRFEFECYDTSHIQNLKYFIQEGVVESPAFIQAVFGILGGTPARSENVLFMRDSMVSDIGEGFEWSVLGAGKQQMSLAAVSVASGGHIRVGLEDSLWIGPGELATSNADQVRKAVSLVESLGLEVASPDEARQLLDLKGKDKVDL